MLCFLLIYKPNSRDKYQSVQFTKILMGICKIFKFSWNTPNHIQQTVKHINGCLKAYDFTNDHYNVGVEIPRNGQFKTLWALACFYFK
jgi:hypothetical protein